MKHESRFKYTKGINFNIQFSAFQLTFDRLEFYLLRTFITFYAKLFFDKTFVLRKY